MGDHKDIVVRSPNYIAFDIDTYKGDVSKMMWDVCDAMKVLVKNEYECRCRYEDAGIYILEFGSCDESFGGPLLRWCDLENLYDAEFLLNNDTTTYSGDLPEDTEDIDEK